MTHSRAQPTTSSATTQRSGTRTSHLGTRRYPGVDLIYYGNQQQLEFDFIVQPGTDPAAIRLGFQGEIAAHALRLKIDPAGNLVVEGPAGGVLLPRPMVYQQAGNRREPVDGTYLLSADQHLSFRLGAYDHTRPVVIDPILTYSTFFGGDGYDQANAVAVDAAGNAYVTGTTNSTNFPTTPGEPGNSTLYDPAFVSKLSPDGSTLLYSTCLGGLQGSAGSIGTVGTSIAVDAAGDAYVAGYTEAVDYPTTPGAFQRTSPSFITAFLTKLNSTGTGLVYSTLIGGSQGSDVSGLAVDGTGHAYLAGDNYSGDFPTTPGAYKTALNQPGVDVYVAKFDPTGSSLVYSTLLGEAATEPTGLALDQSGNVFVTGVTDDAKFPTSRGAFSATGDNFVTKFNKTGSALLYSTRLQGSAVPLGIAIDSAGNAYLTGSTRDDLPTTPGAFETTDCLYCNDAFVSKLNPTGTGLVYSTYLGGGTRNPRYSYEGQGRSIAVDSAGNAFIAGYTLLPTFPTTPDAFQTTYSGGYSDGFFTKLNAAGSTVLYSTYLGGNGQDQASSVALDPAGNAYVAGNTYPASTGMASTFPTTPNTYQPTYGGGESDGFVARFAALTPFCSITARLLVDLDTHRVDEDNYTLDATFTPGADPLTNPISIEIGTNFITVPAGSLVQQGKDYVFHGRIKGRPVSLILQKLGGSSNGGSSGCTGPEYALLAVVRSINIGPLTNPVTVTLTIGDNVGTTKVQATILHKIYE